MTFSVATLSLNNYRMSTKHFCALLFQKIREDILIMKKYFVSCRSAIESRLLWQLQERQHFVENVDSFSLQDLIDINSGDLLEYLEKVQAVFIKHIKKDCKVSAGHSYLLLCCVHSLTNFDLTSATGLELVA
jgi:hypothetical protein